MLNTILEDLYVSISAQLTLKGSAGRKLSVTPAFNLTITPVLYLHGAVWHNMVSYWQLLFKIHYLGYNTTRQLHPVSIA